MRKSDKFHMRKKLHKKGFLTMSKQKSISDLVTDLQKENERLQSLYRLFGKACKNEFGYDIDTIHKMLEKQRLYESRKAAKQQGQTVPQEAVGQGQQVPEL